MGAPVARSTVQNDAVVASRSCFERPVRAEKESEKECRRSPEGPNRYKTDSLDTDNVGNT